MVRARRLTLTVLLAAATLACADEVPPETLSAEVVSFGRFELVDGRPVLAEKTVKIACMPDVLLGVDYRVVASGLRFGGTLPIEFRWRHPELAIPSKKLWGEESSAGPARPELAWGETRLEQRAIWQLEHPDERKDGRYEFIVRVVDGGPVLLSHAFDVEGC